MRVPRLTIAGLMVATALLGVAVAAFRYPSGLWASALFTITLGLLATATLGAILSRGPRRAASLGFALFGWGYLIACFGPWFETSVQPRLLTTRILDKFYESVHANSMELRWYPEIGKVLGPDGLADASKYRAVFAKAKRDGTLAMVNDPSRSGLYLRLSSRPPTTVSVETVREIGHCLFAWLAGFAGVLTARYFLRQPIILRNSAKR